jgi:NAD(P)-dependent dehydrogenase (short-subunit alcohol dehydrogenase family)
MPLLKISRSLPFTSIIPITDYLNSGADMRAQFQTHVFGAIMLIQSLLPLFRAQKSGQILNVSSAAAFDSMGGLGAYCASKAAFEGFSEALADEVRPFGIEVLILQPGFFPTPWFGSTAKTNPVDTPGSFPFP